MAKITEAELKSVLEPHLQPGEELRASAVGYSYPGRWIFLLLLLGVLPGAIIMAIFQRRYVAGLTNRRFLLLRYGGRFNVQEVVEWELGQVPRFATSTGPFHTVIRVHDPNHYYYLKFHRAAMKTNRENAIMIAQAIGQPPQLASGEFGAQELPPVQPPPARRETVAEMDSVRKVEKFAQPQEVDRPPIFREPVLPPPPLPLPDEAQSSRYASRQKTRFGGAPEIVAKKDVVTPQPAKPAPDPRKIVGFLVSYTWQADGQLFPIREGRNLIGRDPQQCDITVPQDDTLSAVNTHITYRKNFVIGDVVSMGGTDVNGQPIEEQFRSLPNYAEIRTGSTRWRFVAIHPAPAASVPANQ